MNHKVAAVVLVVVMAEVVAMVVVDVVKKESIRERELRITTSQLKLEPS